MIFGNRSRIVKINAEISYKCVLKFEDYILLFYVPNF
jgi:hypothetical protein